MVDLSNITVPVDAQTFSYWTGDTVAYVRTQNPRTGEWCDYDVVRVDGGGSSKD